MESNRASVDDALTEDHVRLDGLFRQLRFAVAARDPKADAVRAEFERRLLRHMTWEEEILFPALRAAQADYPGKRIESLVIDHARIREALQDLTATLRLPDWTAAAAEIENVWILLEGHNRDEEKGVYSDADRKIPEAERLRLVKLWTTSTPR